MGDDSRDRFGEVVVGEGFDTGVVEARFRGWNGKGEICFASSLPEISGPTAILDVASEWLVPASEGLIGSVDASTDDAMPKNSE